LCKDDYEKTFDFTNTIANEKLIEDNCTNCKAIFSNTNTEDISTKSPHISNEEIGDILKNALKKIRLYKKRKNSEIERINSRLESIKLEFREYKIEKEREIKNLKSELAIYKKLSKSQKELATSTWIKIVVEDGVDIFQLAIRYYGDRNKYKQIYLANKDIIGDDLQLTDGMSLKIPIIEPFKEQPMFINMD
jgi:hypothetical protein